MGNEQFISILSINLENIFGKFHNVVYIRSEQKINTNSSEAIMKTQKYTINFEAHTVTLNNDNTHSMTFTEAGLFENDSVGKYLTDKDEIIEALNEMYGETPTGEEVSIRVEFEDNPVPEGQYTVTIEDLEELGWEFHPFYEDVSKAMNISIEEAEKYDKEKYDVVVSVYENGATVFRLDAGSEFSDNEATGDDKLTIQDLYYLIQNDSIIRFDEH